MNIFERFEFLSSSEPSSAAPTLTDDTPSLKKEESKDDTPPSISRTSSSSSIICLTSLPVNKNTNQEPIVKLSGKNGRKRKLAEKPSQFVSKTLPCPRGFKDTLARRDIIGIRAPVVYVRNALKAVPGQMALRWTSSQSKRICHKVVNKPTEYKSFGTIKDRLMKLQSLPKRISTNPDALTKQIEDYSLGCIPDSLLNNDPYAPSVSKPLVVSEPQERMDGVSPDGTTNQSGNSVSIPDGRVLPEDLLIETDPEAFTSEHFDLFLQSLTLRELSKCPGVDIITDWTNNKKSNDINKKETLPNEIYRLPVLSLGKADEATIVVTNASELDDFSSRMERERNENFASAKRKVRKRRIEQTVDSVVSNPEQSVDSIDNEPIIEFANSTEKIVVEGYAKILFKICALADSEESQNFNLDCLDNLIHKAVSQIKGYEDKSNVQKEEIIVLMTKQKELFLKLLNLVSSSYSQVP